MTVSALPQSAPTSTTAPGWVVQIFALGSTNLEVARAMVAVALEQDEHAIEATSDGTDAYLVVETRRDEAVLDAVRVAVATADPHASLEHVADEVLVTDAHSLVQAA